MENEMAFWAAIIASQVYLVSVIPSDLKKMIFGGVWLAFAIFIKFSADI